MSRTDKKKATFGLRWWRILPRNWAGLWVMQSCVFDHQFPVHPHCVVMCASSAAQEKKREKTQPIEIPQLTFHAISPANKVLPFWIVTNTKFPWRSLHGTEQGDKKLITWGIGRMWSRLNNEPDLQSLITLLGNKPARRFCPFNQAKTFSEQWAAREKINKHKETNLQNSLTKHSQKRTARSGFWLEKNTKFKERNPHESDKGEEKQKLAWKWTVPSLHSKERLNSRTLLSLFRS
jgi:hypothetical protein